MKPLVSSLDNNQILPAVFDEATGRLRVETTATLVNGAVEVAIDASTDNIEIKNNSTGNTLAINNDGSINVDIVSTGAATLAAQSIAQTSLSLISTNTSKLDTNLSTRATESTLSTLNNKITTTANGVKVDGSNTLQPVSIASLPLPVGAATSGNQISANTLLSSIDTKTPSLGQALASASTPVVLTALQLATLTPPSSINISNFPANQVISGSTASASGTISGNGDIISVGNIASYGGVSVCIYGTFVGLVTFQGSTDGTNFFPVAAINTGIPSSLPTTNCSTPGLFWIPSTFINFKVTSSSYVSGTISAVAQFQSSPARAISSGVSVQGNISSGANDLGYPVKIGAVYNATLPIITSGNRNDIQLNKFGELAVRSRNNYSHITGNTSKTVKTGLGILSKIVICTATTASTITIYDSATASGTIIATINPGGASAIPCTLEFDAEFTTGLTIVTAGLATNDITVVYQ